jgi:hypothetical protein
MPSVAPAVAATPLVLAIDLGTSSVRVLAVDSLGRAIEGSEEQQRYAIGTSVDGAAEMAALPLFDLLIDTIDGALARLGPLTGEIAAVGFTSFWHGLLGLGADGTPATPIFYWGDTRSAPDAAALRHEADEAGDPRPDRLSPPLLLLARQAPVARAHSTGAERRGRPMDGPRRVRVRPPLPSGRARHVLLDGLGHRAAGCPPPRLGRRAA